MLERLYWKCDNQKEIDFLHSIIDFYLKNAFSIPTMCHHFQDITKFTVYMTGCDLEQSFVFKKIVENTSHDSYRNIPYC